MAGSEEKEIKQLLEEAYKDTPPPEHLRRSVIKTIGMMNIIGDLLLLYTEGYAYVFRQLKRGGKES